MIDFERMTDDAARGALKDVSDIVRDVISARRAARKSLRRLQSGDLLSARRWANCACDLEFRALGLCENYAPVAEHLEDDIESCPYKVAWVVYADRLLICRATCQGEACRWERGDKVLSFEGAGLVVSSDGDEAKVDWTGPVLPSGQYVWRTWRIASESGDDDSQHP